MNQLVRAIHVYPEIGAGIREQHRQVAVPVQYRIKGDPLISGIAQAESERQFAVFFAHATKAPHEISASPPIKGAVNQLQLPFAWQRCCGSRDLSEGGFQSRGRY